MGLKEAMKSRRVWSAILAIIMTIVTGLGSLNYIPSNIMTAIITPVFGVASAWLGIDSYRNPK